MSLLTSTQEQIEFESSIASFFSDIVSSESRFNSINAPSTNLDRWQAIKNLGFWDYFSDPSPEGGKLTELGLVAYHVGKNLLPEPLVDALFAGPYLAKHADFKAADISNSEIIGTICFGSNLITKKNELSCKLQHIAFDDSFKFLIIADLELSKVAYLEIDKLPEHSISRQNGLDLLCPQISLQLKKSPIISLDHNVQDLLLQMRTLKALELAGLGTKMIEMTQEHLTTRRQFGVEIGSFQALKHKLSDMYAKLESVRALASFACWAFENSKQQFELASLSAIDQATEKLVELAETAIQLHGGIGFTWEHSLHLFLRRCKTFTIKYRLSESESKRMLEIACNS